jgi:hypothetical protein
MKKVFTLSSLSLLVFLGIGSTAVWAYEVQDLTGVEEKGDFVLGPGKTELWLSPGEKAVDQLLITNRLGKDMNFKIEIEDFKGSRDPEETTVLLGEEKGPYSLKDFLHLEITEFTLKHGQRMILPVEISIPEDAEPGGLYGSVLIATSPPRQELGGEEETAKGQMQLISRLGCLYFIRIKGEVIEDGFLKEFKTVGTTKKFYESGPISFELFFENNSNVHLMPYGGIEIFNILGKKVDEVKIEPYFALPDSLRLREVSWQKEFLFGRYTALASVNRGYQDIIDQKSITFWVIPWKIILAGLVGLFLMIWFFRWLFSKFEIKLKS